MAANFWTSSHCKLWLFSKEALETSTHRRDKEEWKLGDLDIKKIKIYLCMELQSLAKRLGMRQRVVASAIVYFRRFFAKNNFIEFCPRLVAPTCLYIATKVEECSTQYPVCKIANEMKKEDASWPYSFNNLLECEFYVLETLGFYLIVYHPYHSLTEYLTNCNLRENCLETAWNIVNDAYFTDISLLCSPHIISLASINLACFMHNIDSRLWFSELNVEMKEVLVASNELLDFYEMWKKEKDDNMAFVKEIFGRLPFSRNA